MNWNQLIVPLIVGGLAAVAEILADNHDFNWTMEGILHIAEVFIAGVAGTFLIIKGKMGGSSSPPSGPAK